MKAAFVRSSDDFEIRDCPTPEPGPGEALVKIAYCGICGSDLHLLQSGILPDGCIIGHEISGSIAARGRDLTGWNEGDPVSVLPLEPCLSCDQCRKGDTQLCRDLLNRSYGLGKNPGGFAQYMLAKESMLYHVPAGLDLKTAALNEPFAVARHAVNQLTAKKDDLIAVLGAGPIGLLSIYGLQAAGATNIYVSEPDPYRAGQAEKAGIKMVVDPGRNPLDQAVRESAGRGPDCVFDCAGTESSLQEAVYLAGPRGSVMVLGVHLGTVSLIPLLCFAKEIQINFSFGYNLREFGESLGFLARGAVDPEAVISRVLPLSGISEAFQLLRKTGQMKILIDCQTI